MHGGGRGGGVNAEIGASTSPPLTSDPSQAGGDYDASYVQIEELEIRGGN